VKRAKGILEKYKSLNKRRDIHIPLIKKNGRGQMFISQNNDQNNLMAVRCFN
jgi:hypothetical protein